MRIFISILLLIITVASVRAQDLGDSNCDSLLLVSSWFNDNVKIYDGCSGEYIRNLADAGVLDGPQAIFQDHNGDVIVVSESSHKLVKFDRETLSNPTTVVPSGVMQNPITVVKKDNQNIYLGSYSSNQIIQINTDTWQPVRTILVANSGQVQGIDIGMAMGPDGYLYVPGYDSDSILKLNPANGASSDFVSSGDQGLDRPRTVLFSDDTVLVSAWGNQSIVEYNLQGQLQAVPVSNIPGVAGMMQDGPNHILVTSDSLNAVRRYNTNDFSYETVVSSNSGGLRGATFVYRLEKQTVIEDVTGMQQAWVTGVGEIHDNQIIVTEFTSTLGGAFGDDFNPDNIELILWGELMIDFVSCHEAEMSYTSNLSLNGVQFGAGEYSINRMAMNPGGRDCEMSGFQNTTDNLWMAGSFFGGAARNGEGFTIDLLENDRAIVTWYTYLPINQSP